MRPGPRAAAAALVAGATLLGAGCGGGGGSSAQPKADPGRFAEQVVHLIVNNQYAKAWGDLHSQDQQVAPLAEYVGCETRSPVIVQPTKVSIVRVKDESVGLGNGQFVQSKAVDLRLGFSGGFKLVHTVHLVAEHGRWKFILPAWRFRDYRADRCPADAGSSPAPSPA